MYSLDDCVRQLENLGCLCERNVSMKEYTTFRIGGRASALVKPSTIHQVSNIYACCSQHQIPVYLIGKGSNVLVSDNGVNGVVIVLSGDFSGISLEDDTTLVCEAGAPLSKVCRFAEEHALSGLEFAYGIPGTVGGAVFMNAGAYGGEMQDVVTSCMHVSPDGTTAVLSRKELDFSYRHSVYSEGSNCIVEVRLKLFQGDRQEISEKMNSFLNRRKEKQPLDYPSAGSTFKRPKGGYASALIDSCGLKGLRYGGAMVSTKHAGFVINTGDATSEDVEHLICSIKQIVYEQTGFQLEEEIKRIP